jgi:hypothetical protein
VRLLRNLLQWFLWGWPLKLKLMMLSCLSTVIIGNYLLFQQWKERNVEEYVLPYQQSPPQSLPSSPKQEELNSN